MFKKALDEIIVNISSNSFPTFVKKNGNATTKLSAAVNMQTAQGKNTSQKFTAIVVKAAPGWGDFYR